MRTRKYAQLRSQMSPEAQAEARRRADIMLVAMDLQDLLCDRGMTQEELAKQMEIGQGHVSRMLRRTNMHVTTLQDAIEAMGGKLEIIAHFPDKDYRIDQFAVV